MPDNDGREGGARYLNIGSGAKPLKGFVNIDRMRGADLRRDVTNGLPYRDDSVDGIYSEHFLEHLTQREGLAFLRECRRVLKPGATLRIAMPDLDELVHRYLSDDWRGDGDMFKLGYEWVDNRSEMLNLGMREWGHQWVYNEEELSRCAQLAGFLVRGRARWGESEDPRFRNLECRPGSKLIMEFFKSPMSTSPELPLASLVIPAYKPRYFRAALQSALVQTYPNLEILICDDCPDDGIGAVVRQLVADDPRVRYERNVERKGPRGNYVCCLLGSRGEYIKFLNDDDVLRSDCVSRMVEQLRRYPDVTLVACRRRNIDMEGRVIRRLIAPRPLTRADAVIEGRDAARSLLSMGVNWIGEPTAVLFRRRDVIGIRPDLFTLGGAAVPGFGDFALEINLLSKGNLAYLSEPLCDIREHPDQFHLDPDLRKRAEGSMYILRRHAARLGLYRRVFGMPDPLGWLAGYRYRLLGGHGSWRRKLPDPIQTLVFAKKLAEAGIWAGSRWRSLRRRTKAEA